MAHGARKTEHVGAQKGRGAYYGRKVAAKAESNRRRREKAKAEIWRQRDERASAARVHRITGDQCQPDSVSERNRFAASVARL